MKKLILIILCILVASPVIAKNEGKFKKQKQLPPGLEKKYERTGELPPGWQKKLIKGEVLDSEIYKASKHITELPKGYKIEPKAGTEILQIEDRIIRIKKNNKEILDILGVDIN